MGSQKRESLKYSNLPEDNQYYRLDYVGPIMLSDEPSEGFYWLTVKFSPILRDFPRTKEIFSVRHVLPDLNQLFLQFNTGEYLNLKPGSVWLNREKIWEPSSSVGEALSLNVSKEKTSHFPLSVFQLKEAYSPSYLSQMSMAMLELQDIGLPVLFSSPELVRFYFASSSRFNHLLFNGGVDDFSKLVVHNSCFRWDDNKTVELVIRSDLRNGDAPLVARVCLSDVAHHAAKAVYNSISLDWKKNNSQSYFYPKAYFPFEGLTELNVIGSRVKGVHPNTNMPTEFFLVTSINECTASMGFERLIVGREGDVDLLAESDGKEDVYTQPKQRRKRSESQKTHDPAKRANAVLEREEIEQASSRFKAMESVRVERATPETRQNYAGVKKTPITQKDILTKQTSAGIGGYSQDATARGLDFTDRFDNPPPERRERKKPLDATLSMTARMFTRLNKEKDIKIESLFSSCSEKIEGFALGYFPLKDSSGNELSWSNLSESGHPQVRRLLGVKIQINSSTWYAFEFERNDSGSQSFSLYLCEVLNSEHSLPSLLEEIALQKAKGLKGIFKARGLEMKIAKHTSTSLEAFSVRVLSKLLA